MSWGRTEALRNKQSPCQVMFRHHTPHVKWRLYVTYKDSHQFEWSAEGDGDGGGKTTSSCPLRRGEMGQYRMSLSVYNYIDLLPFTPPPLLSALSGTTTNPWDSGKHYVKLFSSQLGTHFDSRAKTNRCDTCERLIDKWKGCCGTLMIDKAFIRIRVIVI